jgi:hypothetical protein
MATAGRNAKGQILIDGTPTFIRLLYDSGLDGVTGTDMAGHLAKRGIARFKGKINVYLNYWTGSSENALKLCDALEPLGMYTLAIGNSFSHFAIGDGAKFDICQDTNGFRARFAAKKRALAIYLADEPDFTEAMQADTVKWHGIYKASMPSLATMVVIMQHGIKQVRQWAPLAVADWFCCDPYPIGQAPEDHPQGAQSIVHSFGYANFEVGQACADVAYYAKKHGKSPVAVLGMLKQGGPLVRYQRDDESWSHMVAAIAEGCVGIAWWSIGNGNGALNHPTDVTPQERERMLAYLDVMTSFLVTLEPVLLSDPSPSLLTKNSGSTLDPVAWRKALVTAYHAGWPDSPAWNWFTHLDYEAELAKLNQTPPDLAFSEQMLDQSSNVRTRCWEDGKIGWVFAYNVHPLPQTVTFTCRVPVRRVEVVDESRVVALGADGRSWTDTFGGGSSLKQGPFRQGHVYKLTLDGGPAPDPSPDPTPDPTPGPVTTQPTTLRIDYTVQDASGKTLGKGTQEIAIAR